MKVRDLIIGWKQEYYGSIVVEVIYEDFGVYGEKEKAHSFLCALND
jgi:hypothetical protein